VPTLHLILAFPEWCRAMMDFRLSHLSEDFRWIPGLETLSRAAGVVVMARISGPNSGLRRQMPARRSDGFQGRLWQSAENDPRFSATLAGEAR
jgi:hypothetical protein